MSALTSSLHPSIMPSLSDISFLLAKIINSNFTDVLDAGLPGYPKTKHNVALPYLY